MKKINLLIIVSLILFNSCKEETIGQFSIDNVPPKQISDPKVVNFKGGATLTYTLPDDMDLLYVKAVYILPNGEKMEEKASAYTNTITIKGFSKSAKSTIELVTVDRSRNESEPVLVEINPLDSPIFEILAKLRALATFGGIKLNWENLDNEEVIIDVLIMDEDNTYSSIEKFYTSTSGSGAVRNQKPVESHFGIYVSDFYNNHTDTLFLTLTPMEESELDKKLWKPLKLCPNIKVNGYGTTDMKCLWNEVYINTNAYEQMYYLNDGEDGEKAFFTFDLGVSAQLSRFKFWGRTNWYFNLHHPKEFEIWGTNDSISANSDPCSWYGWELLTTGISEKPSGPDPVSSSMLTSEDLALALSGEEFEFPAENPPVRFIRFKKVRSWTDSPSMFISELSFWGKIEK